MNDIINLEYFMPLLPEISVLATALFVLVAGLVKNYAKACWWIAILGISVAAYYSLNFEQNLTIIDLFDGMIMIDNSSQLIKLVLIILTMLILIFYGGVIKIKNWDYGLHEYIFITLLALIGSMLLVSSRNLLMFYVSLELVSLSSYVLVAYDRDKLLSTESGVKYFILGSLSSCILIFGLSFIYGFSGTLDFKELNSFLNYQHLSPGIMIGFFLLIASLLFKLSIVPFHAWTTDVYQGAPLIVVAFISSVPKLAMVSGLINIINWLLVDLKNEWSHIFIVFGLLSVIFGSFGAIVQNSIKRLMGYSAILNMGLVLLVLSSASTRGFSAALIYQIIYGIAVIGLFATLSISIDPESEDFEINELSGFGRVKKLAAFSISVFMFSIAGIPPFAGFFGKYLIFSSLIDQGYYLISGVTILITVASAFYYINIIKVIYFLPPVKKVLRLHETKCLITVSAICTVISLTLPLLVKFLFN